MALETEATKSMTDTRKDLNQYELTIKKLKRILEVSSITCSTASISMVIACLYGDVPEILGLKSQMIFDLAFSLLVTSVVLGTLAMATSSIQDRKLEISFPALRISTLFSSVLTALLCLKNEGTAAWEKIPEPLKTQPVLIDAECIQNLKEKRSNEEYSNSLDNLSMKNGEDSEYSLKNSGKSTVFFPSSDKSSEIKCLPQLQKCHTPFLLGHCSLTKNPVHFTDNLKFMQFDLKHAGKKSQLAPLLQQTFITNGHFNEVNTRNISDKHPQVGIVSPIKINSNDPEYCDLYKNLAPSIESIYTYQKHLKKGFNSDSLVEEQSFYQNTGRMSNACFKVDNNILYESNIPIHAFHKFPTSQQKVFKNSLHTTDLQNLHEVQKRFLKIKCQNSREISYADLLQTIPESSEEFSYKRSEIAKFKLGKMQKVDSGDHCNKLHRKVTRNFKSFQYPLRDFKEAPNSQKGIINSYCGWNMNSKEWSEEFAESPDIPMEICDKSSNDEVLEVSMKLSDLNFMF